MHAHATRTVSLALLAMLVLAATGCSSGDSEPTTPATSTVEPTIEATAAPTTVAGPITTPQSGSAARTAILKAVSLGLGVSSKLTVYQLYAQDGAAVGDVLPSGGTRTFVALAGGPDAWALEWSAPFGSTLANSDALNAIDPASFTALAAKLDFTKKVAKPVTKAVAPTLASFEAYAQKSATTFAGDTYAGTFTVTAKIAKDSTGAWWGNAIAEPNDTEGLEAIGIWGRYSGGKWSGEIADFSTEGADAGYFPADVLAKLAL